MMKTIAERDKIDTNIIMARADVSRHRKILLLLDYQAKHGCVDGELLEYFGRAEYERGVHAATPVTAD